MQCYVQAIVVHFVRKSAFSAVISQEFHRTLVFKKLGGGGDGESTAAESRVPGGTE